MASAKERKTDKKEKKGRMIFYRNDLRTRCARLCRASSNHGRELIAIGGGTERRVAGIHGTIDVALLQAPRAVGNWPCASVANANASRDRGFCSARAA